MSEIPSEILVSADSHVIETPTIWTDLLPRQFFGAAPDRAHYQRGADPTKRVEAMGVDGVAAEVLYPTLGLKVFCIEDVELHEESCRVYNRWLIEYCNVNPMRMLGLALIPCYRPEVAIAELLYCHTAGLRGAMVWRTPHPDLPFTSRHYDPVWKVAEELRMPVNVHIISGFDYTRTSLNGDKLGDDPRLGNLTRYHRAVNEKVACTADTLFAFIFSGVFDRFPDLKLVIVENEVAWLPFYLDQWDYISRLFGAAPGAIAVDGLDTTHTEMTKSPSAYFVDSVLVTFFRDPWVGRLLPSWGKNNLMWSNDFPHTNSTWPNSQDYVAKQMSGLDGSIKDRVLRQNCTELYSIDADLLIPTS